MDAKVWLISIMVSVGTLIGVQQPTGIADEKEELAKYYESCIVKTIKRCESRVELLETSRSVTLRQYAELHDKKAEFFDAEKDMLIDLMIKNRIEPKKYKIEHFLEEQFYESMAK
jgi:hypothetical protein